MSERQIRLDQLIFPSYWPEGSPEVVREFLKTKYNPLIQSCMPDCRSRCCW